MTTVVGTPPGVTASGYKSVPFTPARLNLAAWWDASDAATIVNPSDITQWNDKSGNVRTLTPPGTGLAKTFTIKGKPMVGTVPLVTDTAMRCPGWTRQSVETIIGVFWTNTLDAAYPATGNFWFWREDTGDRSLYWQGGTFYSGYGSFVALAGTLNDNVRVFAACSNGASSWLDVDRNRSTGNNATTPPVGFRTTSDTWSGYSTGGPGIGTAELMIVNGTISASDLTNTYNYLSAKWGTP